MFSESISYWQPVLPCSDPVPPSTNQYRPPLTQYSMIWWVRPCKPSGVEFDQGCLSSVNRQSLPINRQSLPFPQVSEVIEHAKFALQTKYNFSVPVKAIVVCCISKELNAASIAYTRKTNMWPISHHGNIEAKFDHIRKVLRGPKDTEWGYFRNHF